MNFKKPPQGGGTSSAAVGLLKLVGIWVRVLQDLPEGLFSMEGRILFDRGGIQFRQNNAAD